MIYRLFYVVIVSCVLFTKFDVIARHFSCLWLHLAGLDSVFGTATCYRLDGLGFEAGVRSARYFLFSTPGQTGSGSQVQGLIGWGAALTTHSHWAPRLSKSRAISTLPSPRAVIYVCIYIYINNLTTNNVIGPVLQCRLYVQPQQRNMSGVDCGSRCCHVMKTQSLIWQYMSLQ